MPNLLLIMILLLAWTTPAHAIKIGFRAPPFTLPNTHGELISLSDFKGKHVVLEWFNPDCRTVQRHYQKKNMRQLALNYMGREVIWLAINSTYYMTQEDNKRWKDVNLLHYRLLNDSSGEVARLYQVQNTPQMYVINPSGILIYMGAIDNDPIGNQPQPFNYVQAALEDSLAGRSVTYPQTQPYGCLVKYKY